MRPKIPRKRIAGYWQVRATDGATWYVKQHYLKRTAAQWRVEKAKRNEARKLRRIVGQPKASVVLTQEELPGILWRNVQSEPEYVSTMAWAIRILALVDFNYQYPMSFRPADFDDLKPRSDSKHLQYYMTHFWKTKREACQDFHSKAHAMEFYGTIDFLEIELVQVSGEGPMVEKTWVVIESYDAPKDVPYAP